MLSGYQEVITDPSYAGQIITFTYPHIGNYGVNRTDFEARRPFCRGVVVRDLARRRSSWRSRGRPRRAAAGLRRPRHRRHRHPQAHPPDPGAGRHAWRLRAARPHRRGRRCSRRPRRSPAPTASTSSPQVTTAEPYRLGRRLPPAGGGLRLRHQAHDPPPPRDVVRRRGRTGLHRRGRRARSRARRGLPVERSGRPGVGAVRRARRSPRCSATCRCSASASVTSSSAGRSAAATVKLPFGHHGGNHPVRNLATGQDRDHQPEPQLRGRRRLPRRAGRDEPRQPQRRCLRGAPGARRAGVQRAAPSRGRSRPPRQRVPVRGVRQPARGGERRDPAGLAPAGLPQPDRGVA